MTSWEQYSYQEAHESEILSIDITTGPDALVATGSRDRLLHVFDLRSGCQLVQTLDDHSSSITAVKFTQDATQLVSSSADKGVIFRRKQPNEAYGTYQNNSGRSTVFDMAMDVHDRCVATVTGERRLYLFHVDSGKPFRMCKPDLLDEPSGGSLINIDLDPFSATYAITSGSDRCLRLFDLTNSTCVEKVGAHAEQITAVKFVRTNTDELRVVSTCSDSTIFVWIVSQEIVAKMCARAGLAPEEKPRSVARLRRASTITALKPSLSQSTRKTFSTMSTTEHKYDEVYRKIEAGRRRPSQIQVEDRKKPNGPPKRNPLLPPTRPNNRLVQNLTHMRQGRNPDSLRKAPVLSKRPSQPTLEVDVPKVIEQDRQEEKSNSVDEDEEEVVEEPAEDEEEDEEEEIIFTPEQEKVSKPFKVSTHIDHPAEEVVDEDRNLTVSDTPEEESSDSSDEEAILRDITSLEPPRMTASRSIIRRSMPRKKRTKRQSFTAKFLSSLPAETNEKTMDDHVFNKEPTEADTKLESALADLDGIVILLDSVLDTLRTTERTKENEGQVFEIQTKLDGLSEKIGTQTTTPDTNHLLEKYSNLLLTMVQSKLNS